MTTDLKRYITESIVRALGEERDPNKQSTRSFKKEMEDIDGIHVHSVDGQHLYADPESDRGEVLMYHMHNEPTQQTHQIELYPEDGKKTLANIKKDVKEQIPHDVHPEIAKHLHKNYNAELGAN